VEKPQSGTLLKWKTRSDRGSAEVLTGDESGLRRRNSGARKPIDLPITAQQPTGDQAVVVDKPELSVQPDLLSSGESDVHPPANAGRPEGKRRGVSLFNAHQDKHGTSPDKPKKQVSHEKSFFVHFVYLGFVSRKYSYSNS
jgi:hypothetical protein